ncbi:MAG: GNAT family N-acetyltransferase [Pseudonocardiales bacterium]|nr:GNAT family N-acetyltransferase [Actinomycetota bacterium]
MTDQRRVHAIQTALRDAISDGATRVGPFLVTIDPAAPGPFRNFAVPDDHAAPRAGDIAALCEYFDSVGRLTRLEFVAPQPTLEQALADAGFVIDNRLTVLALPDGSALREAPLAPGLILDEPSTDERLRALAAMQNAAYGEDGVNDADVARLNRTRAGGGAVVAAWDADGFAVAGGVLGTPRGALAEIYGIAVAADQRRRGLGSAVAAALSRIALNRGIAPYLQCEGPGERRMYEGIGYEKVGELIDSRAPAPAGQH